MITQVDVRPVGHSPSAEPPNGASVAGLPVLCRIGALSVLAEAFEAAVIIATSGVDPATTTRLMRQLADVGVHVELSFAVRGVAHDRLIVTERGRLAVAHVVPPIRGMAHRGQTDLRHRPGRRRDDSPRRCCSSSRSRSRSTRPGPCSFANTASAVTVSSSRS